MRKGSVNKLTVGVVASCLLLLECLFAQLPAPANRYWEAPPMWAAQPELALAGKQSGLLVDVLKGGIRIYQQAISTQDLQSCMFHPSCSRFAFDALREFGSVRGYLLAADRLLRCSPFTYLYYSFDGEKFVDPVTSYRFDTDAAAATREKER